MMGDPAFPPSRSAARYAFAAGVGVVSIGVRLLLDPILGTQFPFLLFFPAIMASAWFWGVGPGFFCIGITVAASIYFFTEPVRGFQVPDSGTLVALALFVLEGVVFTLGTARLRRANRSLKASEAQFRSLFEDAPIGICVSRDEKIVMVNAGYRKLFAIPPQEDVSGKSQIEQIAPNEKKRVQTFIAKGMDPLASRQSCETVGVRRDGTECALAIDVAPLNLGDGFAAISFMSDITERKAAESALQESQTRLQRFLDYSPAVIFLKDKDLRYVLVNRQFEQVFNVNRKDAAGKRIFDWAPPATAERLNANDRQVVENQKPMQFEEIIPHSDGDHIYASVKFPMIDRHGNFDGMGGIALDMTESRKAHQALIDLSRRLQLAQDAARIGTFEWNLDSGAVEWSSSAERLFGLEAGVFGRTYEALKKWIHPQDMEKAEREMRHSSESREPLDSEFRIIRPDGAVRWIASKGRVYEGEAGRSRTMVGIYVDITEVVGARLTLAQRREELEQQVAERTKSLDQLTEQLNAFCYSVAHDLRAPLRAQLGLSQILVEDFAQKLGEEGKSLVDKIDASGRRLSRLIDDLLDYARMSQQELKLDTVNIEESVQQAQADLASEITERKATLSIATANEKVKAHPESLTLIIANLFSNALKYVAPGVLPKIKVSTEQRNGYVRLKIEDNGIGIPAEQRERIFGLFERLRSGPEYPGTGMGLAIVRRGVERMGGRVGVEANNGQGSTFWVDLQPGEARYFSLS